MDWSLFPKSIHFNRVKQSTSAHFYKYSELIQYELVIRLMISHLNIYKNDKTP